MLKEGVYAFVQKFFLRSPEGAPFLDGSCGVRPVAIKARQKSLGTPLIDIPQADQCCGVAGMEDCAAQAIKFVTRISLALQAGGACSQRHQLRTHWRAQNVASGQDEVAAAQDGNGARIARRSLDAIGEQEARVQRISIVKKAVTRELNQRVLA